DCNLSTSGQYRAWQFRRCEAAKPPWQSRSAWQSHCLCEIATALARLAMTGRCEIATSLRFSR
ncbi:MAG: hypothetical protein WEA08_01725, partial [Woeseia sp.]